MRPDDLERKIRLLLRTELGVDEEVTADTELITTGLIDSVGVVRLATFLEREIDITVDNQDITVDNFGTLRRIQAYVQRRLDP
jgi:acyl carrier protein